MKAFAPILVFGLAGMALLKLIFALIVPMIAVLGVLAAVAFKVTVFALAFYVVLRLIRRCRPRPSEATG